jgi:CHAD domain-containing protein
LIYTRLEAVRAYEAILPQATIPQLHLLRIEFKKLRYAVEFFRDV